MREIGVGLIGIGTVGAGVVQVLQENGDEIARRLGARLKLVKIADKVGSSRVDLQACKLEYSIVSPK